eukprot:5933663-Pyramimonas_sp.AAC.1
MAAFSLTASSVSLHGGLVALSQRKIHSAKATRGRRSVVTRAKEEVRIRTEVASGRSLPAA